MRDIFAFIVCFAISILRRGSTSQNGEGSSGDMNEVTIAKDRPDEPWITETGEEGVRLAKERHAKYREVDPFPSIPPALLGSPAFLKYIRTTAMVHPFRGYNVEKGAPDTNLVKPASYEVRPGKSFFRFTDSGELKEQKLDDKNGDPFIKLPPNSITFVSTEETFRLPLYIAVRFNLRISHVHRGILLGTGPLIDPGYDRPILIPLHNLTDREYHISLSEGLIWVEFTKVFPSSSDDLWTGEFETPRLPPTTSSKSFREFLFAAGRGAPIRSSITEVKRDVEMATRRVGVFEKRIRNISIFAVISLLLAVAGLLYPTLTLVFNANQNIDSTRTELNDLRERVKELEDTRPEGASGSTGKMQAAEVDG